MQVLSIVLYRRTLSTRTFRSIYNNSIVISRVQINDELAIKSIYITLLWNHYTINLNYQLKHVSII